MKKKMAMMCIAGVMAVSLCACGNKSTQTGSDAAQTTGDSFRRGNQGKRKS